MSSVACGGTTVKVVELGRRRKERPSTDKREQRTMEEKITSSAIITERDELRHNGRCVCLCCVVYSGKPFIQLSSGWGYYVLMLIAMCRYSHWPLKQLSTFHEYLRVGTQYTNSACSHMKPIPWVNARELTPDTECTLRRFGFFFCQDRGRRKAASLWQNGTSTGNLTLLTNRGPTSHTQLSLSAA